jgi:ABC-type transporter Mla subunit MlaD
MRSFLTRKRTLALSVVAVLVVAAAAFAYWTTTGSGTGSASTGSDSGVTVSQVGSISGLKPGSPAQAVDFKISNPSSQSQYISTVAVSISSVTGPNIDGSHPCDASDFTLTQPSAINQDLASGDTTFSPSGASLALKNTSSNQDGCKGATVNLAFNAS